ncbi:MULTISPECIES: sugar ABC transporter substrate-binding protein [Streptococcus]|jgi:ribose ABC transporter ribose-binding protein|uniref:Sugar ABC transporter substrate-binding protein n=2 Tax=Streptococcus gordonii TaxID=1302 RepID=A0AB35FWB9_STRGN|nr:MULTISPECIES: sugar ABC transporter substrate-binding protein [Streptococcus]ARC47873.2 sugar ABC transporter substrate-binding protein [Streptococcus gordonii]ATF64718.1 GntR family transcriptional regulator [Streptococcus gordonii]MBS6244399.1 sugar ABC transporter substrate-binding protein [Streptococcus sp.]MBW7663676.1 sugar ABC transporter substrate-binding protein [Streptococcus gordonii]MBZ2128380.1 sugar ABC transporter substrate-binding protein [Streptococcus gordonii]
MMAKKEMQRSRMHYKNTLWPLLVLLVMALSFVYFKGILPDPKQVKIGVTYMTMNNDFYKTLNAELEKKTNQQGSRLYVRDPELDEGKQSQQIDFFVKEKVNVIVINPVKSNSPSIISSLQKAKKAGIKIIVVDTPISKEVAVDTTIVSDNYQAGVLIAKDMMKRLPAANILLLEHRNAVSAMDRIRGFVETIKNQPQYKIISQKETLGQTEEAMPQVKSALDEGMDFNVVMALNDRAAIGALAAIKNNGLNRKLSIYGVDGSPDIKNFLATTNDIEGTVAQSPIQMGRKVAQVIELMQEGKSYDSQYLIPVHLVNRDNISQYTVTGWQ